MVDELERLAEPRALIRGQRQLIDVTVVLDPLAAPDLAADVDDLTGGGQRLAIRHTVPALDYLRSTRS